MATLFSNEGREGRGLRVPTTFVRAFAMQIDDLRQSGQAIALGKARDCLIIVHEQMNTIQP
jgi:hypothetical protein